MMGSQIGIPNGSNQVAFQVGECVCVSINGTPTLITPIYTWNFKTKSLDVRYVDQLGQAITLPAGSTVLCIDECLTCAGPTPNPQINAEKEGVLRTTWAVGNFIDYTFEACNTGNTVLNNVEVDDSVIAVMDLAMTPSTLQPGECATAAASYQITQADIDRGYVRNIATASGVSPEGVTVTDPTTDPTDPGPGGSTQVGGTTPSSISVDKQITSTGPYVAGSTISGRYCVTNTGGTTLTNIAITDTNATVVGSPIASLLPGVVNCTATWSHVITAAEVAAGSHTNTVTVEATTPSGTLVTGTDTVTQPLSQPSTTGPIPDVNKAGPWAADGCSGLATYAALITCLQGNGYTVNSVNGAITDGPMLPATLSGFSSNGTSQISANGTTTDDGALTAVWTKTPGNLTTGSQISGSSLVFEGDNNVAGSNSPDFNLALTNTSGREAQFDFVFDPRSALAGAIETNISSFQINYDTAKFDAILIDPGASSVAGLPNGSIIPPNTTFNHTPITTSDIQIRLQPKAGVYCPPGATTNFEWKPTYTVSNLRNESYSANISMLVRKQAATITITGSPQVNTITCGTPAQTINLTPVV